MAMSVKGNLFILTAVGPVFAGAIVLAGIDGLRKVEDQTRQLGVLTAAVRNQMECDMMHDALRGDVFAALLAATPEEHERVGADFADHCAKFRKNLRENIDLGLDDEVNDRFRAIEPVLEQYEKSAQQVVHVSGTDREAARSAVPGFVAQFGVLEGKMSELSDMIEAKASDAQARSSEVQARATRLMVGGWVAASLAMAAIGMLLGRRLALRISRITSRLKDISEGEGDLATRLVNVEGNDELAELARSFNKFSARIHDIIKQVHDVSQEVRNVSSDIVASMTDTSGIVDGQTTAVHQISAAIEQLSMSVTEVAKGSQHAAETAREAGAKAFRGQEVIGRSIDSMRKIDAAVTAGTERVVELGTYSEQISQIINVIQDIADQTNLLALNAAIEAARAGQHGKGFAVVADEVRKLAGRTSSATKQVSDSIRSIQRQTDSAIDGMKTGAAQAREGVAQAGDANSSLDAIVATSSQTSEMISGIAASVDEQRAAGDDISKRAAEIRNATDQARSRVQESASAAERLLRQAATLHSVVNVFRLDRRAGTLEATRVKPDGLKCSLGELVNVSMSGVQVRFKGGGRKVGELVRFTIQGGNLAPQDVQGRVIWIETRSGHHYCGIEHSNPVGGLAAFVEAAIRGRRLADDQSIAG